MADLTVQELIARELSQIQAAEATIRSALTQPLVLQEVDDLLADLLDLLKRLSVLIEALAISHNVLHGAVTGADDNLRVILQTLHPEQEEGS